MISIPNTRPLGDVRSTATWDHEPGAYPFNRSVVLRSQGKVRSKYQINDSLTRSEYSVLFIDLRDSCESRRWEVECGLGTSSNLKAALLLRPCTFASLANLSRPCRLCQIFDDELEHRLCAKSTLRDGGAS